MSALAVFRARLARGGGEALPWLRLRPKSQLPAVIALMAAAPIPEATTLEGKPDAKWLQNLVPGNDQRHDSRGRFASTRPA